MAVAIRSNPEAYTHRFEISVNNGVKGLEEAREASPFIPHGLRPVQGPRRSNVVLQYFQVG